jgi:hypothetical protein
LYCDLGEALRASLQGFDFPVIAKRMLINRIVIPNILTRPVLNLGKTQTLTLTKFGNLAEQLRLDQEAICMAFWN